MKVRLLSFILLSIGDALISLYCINNGIGVEANPLMAYVIGNPQLFLFIKSGASILLALLVGRKEDSYSNLASWIMVIVMLLIWLWNVSVLIVTIF